MPSKDNTVYRTCQLVTYYNDTVINRSLQSAYDDGLIIGAEYIYHDRDGVEPHYHINVRFSSPTRVNKLIDYFHLNNNNNKQNVLHEKIKGTLEDAHKYLYHANNSEKISYDESSIVTIGNYSLCKNKSDTKKIDYMRLIDDMLNCTSHREMICKYGRDYIYHYNDLCTMAVLVAREDGGSYTPDVVDYLNAGKKSYDAYRERMYNQTIARINYYKERGIDVEKTIV